MMLGQRAYQSGDLEQAQEAFLAAAEQVAQDGEEIRLATSLNNLAAVYRRKGDPRAIQVQEHSLALLRNRYGAEHPELAAGLGNLAEQYLQLERFSDAEAAFLAAVALARKGPDRQLYRQCLERLASYYLQLEKLPDATSVYEELRDSVQGDADQQQSEDRARVLHMLANLFDAQGRFEEAEQARQQTLDILTAQWGARSQQLVEVILNMSDSLAANQQMETAAAYVARARALVDDEAAKSGLVAQQVLYLREAGRLGEAEEVSQSWLSSSGMAPGSAGARLQNELGLALFLQKRYSEAVIAFQASLESWTNDGEALVSSRSATRFNLASAWMGLERWPEAEEELGIALTLAEEHLGRDHPLLERILLHTLEVQARLGKHTEAERVSKRLEEMSSRSAP
jgi:tetratricopeptide (TPR) repeat protein